MADPNPPLTIADIQHGAFVSPSARLGLEQSIHQPLRYANLMEGMGREFPERLTPRPFSNAPAVAPGPAFQRAASILSPTYSATSNFPAFLASGFSGGADPSDIDPQTGLPAYHQPSLFKTMASPTRMLTHENVAPQMPIPFDPSVSVFDTKTGMFKKYAVAPSNEMVDIYHRQDEIINPRERTPARERIAAALMSRRG